MTVKHKDHLSCENTLLSQQIYTSTHALTCLQCLFTAAPKVVAIAERFEFTVFTCLPAFLPLITVLDLFALL